MTAREALGEGSRILAERGCGSPTLDASLLLAHCLSTTRSGLLGVLGQEFPGDGLSRYRDLIGRRALGSPVAYLVGHREFRGLDFIVSPSVLIPRPETEFLVEAALEAAKDQPDGPLRLHDLCAGSGCVGISLYRELLALRGGELHVSLSDVSAQALALARENSRRLLGFELPWRQADLLDGYPASHLDILVSNPPYVDGPGMRDISLRNQGEPVLALDGGQDGLAVYRRLIPQAARVLAPGGHLLMEIGDGQAQAVADLMAASGFGDTCLIRDLAGQERVLGGRAPWKKG